MGIFDSFKKNLFGNSFENKIMKSIDKPVFIKNFNRESEEIIKLNELLNNAVNEDEKKKILNQINLQRYVTDGLGKVYFELTNSPVPFYGIHNIRLEDSTGAANIDFLLLTHQFCCLVKCKSLQGNIEIDSQGNFNRWMKKNDKWYKEGLYSPIEQNRRAELIVKNILSSSLGVEKLPILSFTVFTNPKATLNFKECPDGIIEKIVKVDLVNTKLKELVQSTSTAVIEEAKVKEITEKLVQMDKGNDWRIHTEQTKKENIIIEDKEHSESKEQIAAAEVLEQRTSVTVEDRRENLVKALKAYRSSIAASNNIPPYFIFNNEEMERLIEAMPKNREELLKVKGFGQVKVDRYGDSILDILNSL